MDDRELHQRVVALYDVFTHEPGRWGGDRRAFMHDVALLAGSAAAANALIAGIGANPASAAVVPPSDARLKTQEIGWTGSAADRKMKGYAARPAGPAIKRPAVMVIHENRGLNDHIRDVCRRVALAGYIAVAPDFLSPVGGTPANEDTARDMIGKLDLTATVADAIATARWLGHIAQSTGRVGTVGFCWGGAMVNRVAASGGDAIKAAVAYYGPTPDPARAVGVKSAVMLHYAGLDERVNGGAPAWIAALKGAGVDVRAYTYEGVNHAFNNDTAVGRYDKPAADLAWSRTLAFFKAKLAP